MASRVFLKHHFRNALLASLLSLVAVTILQHYSAFSGLDHIFYDLRFFFRGPIEPSGNITLVLLDDKSAIELENTKGGWSRRDMAVALEHLCAAGAETIAIDLKYDRPDSQPGNDRQLKRAFEVCNNVVLARIASAPGVGEVAALEDFQESMIGDGFIDVPLDTDGVLRRMQFLNARPLADGTLQLLPSFALEAVRVFKNIDFSFDFSNPHSFRMGEAENAVELPYPELLINYYGKAAIFSQIPFYKVVNNDFDPRKVKGRLIFIGSSRQGDKDFFSTPVSRFFDEDSMGGYSQIFGTIINDVLGEMDPGIVCHANAAETILTGAYIEKISPRMLLLFLVFSCMLGGIFYLPKRKLLMDVGILCLFITVPVAVSLLLFVHFRIQMEITAMLVILVLQFTGGVILQRNLLKNETAYVTSMFGRYVSPGVAKELLSGNISEKLEGQTRRVSILFSDLRDFTSLAEELEAREVGLVLNTYFDHMLPLVFQYKGTLDKLIGDAVMAFFGAPVHFDDHAVMAAKTALHMLERLEDLKAENKRQAVKRLEVGIGINTGEVTVGNLGSNVFADYTIIGDAVNLASRLEGLNKMYGTKIIVSETTAGELGDEFVLRELDRVRVKGKKTAVHIFELIGLKNKIAVNQRRTYSLFEDGLKAYRQKNWVFAQSCFEKVLEHLPDDLPARLYLDRIVRDQNADLPENWDGTAILYQK